ncbi:MAG TPA: diguanylate cyclase, partial [Candidatus Obscuribacterales bacterium]
MDRAAVDAVFQQLSNPETGLMTYPAFLFFFVREYTQYQITQRAFSVILAEFCISFSGGEQNILRPLPPRAVRQLAQRIFPLTRPLDWVAHYDQTEYALLLPNTNRQTAGELASSIVQAAASSPLMPDMDPALLTINLGIATFPDDTNHPGV